MDNALEYCKKTFGIDKSPDPNIETSTSVSDIWNSVYKAFNEGQSNRWINCLHELPTVNTKHGESEYVLIKTDDPHLLPVWGWYTVGVGWRSSSSEFDSSIINATYWMKIDLS